MKLAVSNIALTAYDHLEEFGPLAEMGMTGMEVAPSRVWHDTWHGLNGGQVAAYRRAVEDAGLTVVGLHSLLYDHPEFGLFRPETERRDKLDHLVHLSGVCRDLGGRTLVYGGGRRRGGISLDDAFDRTLEFCNELCRRIEDHGTVLCFEPLGADKTDFINSVRESIAIVKAVDSPALQVQLDAEALVTSGENTAETFETAAPYLVHYHANDLGLGVLGSSGKIDHATLGMHLRMIGYDGFVSVEQRMFNEADPLSDIRRSVDVLRSCYG